MSDTAARIVGIRISPSSKDRRTLYYNYYFTTDFTEYDYENSEVQGVCSGVEFATVDIGCQVGDLVEFKYRRGFQDRAQLIGCTILESVASTAEVKPAASGAEERPAAPGTEVKPAVPEDKPAEPGKKQNVK